MKESCSRNLVNKKNYYNFLITFISCLLAFMLLEVIISIFIPQRGAWTLGMVSDRYHHLLIPNHHMQYTFIGTDYIMDVKTNSMGFRSEEEFDPTREDTINILFLGDSFTFGQAVDIEDRFDVKLKPMLERTGNKYQFINTGVGGWGTVQESLFATDHFDLFKPDIIVLTFCSNDPNDDEWFLRNPQYPDQNCLRSPVLRFLRIHLDSFRLVQTKIFLLWREQQIRKFIAVKKGPIFFTDKGNYFCEEDWDRTLGYMRKLHQDFITFNPDGIMIVQADLPANEYIREKLSSLDNGKNLLYLDMYERISKIDPKDLIFPWNAHWNPRMHAISAEALFEVLNGLPIPKRLVNQTDSSQQQISALSN